MKQFKLLRRGAIVQFTVRSFKNIKKN